MQTLVRMDEKGRVQIPTRVRKTLKLKSRQLVHLEVRDNGAFLKKAERPKEQKDRVLRDILLKPAHSKIRITAELLDKLREEVWTP